jgi:hypothetical protein
MCGRPMAQHGAGTTSQDRSHPAPPHTQHRVADRVHAKMDRVKRPTLDPASHRTRSDAHRQKLSARDHAVLPLRKRSDDTIDGLAP